MEIRCLNPQQNPQNKDKDKAQQPQRHNKEQGRPDRDIGRQGGQGQGGQKQPGNPGAGQPGQKNPGQGQSRQ